MKNLKKRFRHLNYEDRKTIEKMRYQGKKVVIIANTIGFNRTTIYRELKRGGIPYCAETAQMSMKKCSNL